jgi:ABC-type sugar transport system ATPase subunit
MSAISGILTYSAVVPLGVPESVLTQNVQPAPNTQQAEQSWLHTRKRITRRASQFFLKINKKTKQLDTKAWNLPGGTRQFHIYGQEARWDDT